MALNPTTFLHCFLEVLCKWSPPRSYLEVGVREGCSLRRVLRSSLPSLRRVVLCDNWGYSFGGTGRGSHSHVAQIMRKYSEVDVLFLDGDSKDLVPKLNEGFELAVVDGDHSYDGAWQDLMNAWHLLEPGGIIVFDDIAHPAHQDLLGCFDAFFAHIMDAGVLLSRETKIPFGAGAILKRDPNFKTNLSEKDFKLFFKKHISGVRI